MEPRYTTSRYSGVQRPRSPTFNPARTSLPSSLGFSNSMYSGDLHALPTSSRYGAASSARYAYSPTTAYAPTKDPLSRAQGGLREGSRNRRSTTLDSTSARPVIVTTTQRPSGSSSSSSHAPSTSARHGSPPRDDYRVSDSSFYTQPASSIRSRSHQRGASYGASATDDPYMRSGDGLLSTGGAYRSSRAPPVYHNSSTWSTPVATVDYGGDGYEYYAPSDLARHDLSHDRPSSRTRRRESFDRPYYSRPQITAPTDTSRPYGTTSSRYDRGGPPPTTRGFDKIGRGYDAPLQSPLPPSVPALTGSGSPKEKRSSGSPELPPATGADSRGARRRPISLYQESSTRPSHQDDYYRSRDDDWSHRPNRDLERDYDSAYESPRGDLFRDDSVSTRGFGIRTDPRADARTDVATVGTDYDDRHESRKDTRTAEPVKVVEEEVRRVAPPVDDDHHRRRARDSSRAREHSRVREPSRVRDSSRVDRDRDHRDRRTSSTLDDEAERKRLRDKLNEKVGAGLGIAATALGFNHLANVAKDKKEEKDEKKDDRSDREPRRRSNEDEREPRRDEDRYRPREESREPRTRAPVIVETRMASRDDADRTRSRRDADGRDARRDGDSPNIPSTRDGSPEDDDKSKPRRRRGSVAFNPNNATDIKNLKEELAAIDKTAPASSSSTAGSAQAQPVPAAAPSQAAPAQRPAPVPAPAPAPAPAPIYASTSAPGPAAASVPPPRPPKERIDRPAPVATDIPLEPRTPRDLPRESSRDLPRESPRGLPRESSRELPRESSRDLPREAPRDVPRDPPRDVPRDQTSFASRKEPSIPSPESTLVGEGSELRGREPASTKSEEKQVRVVSPPRDKSDAKPLRGILKQPRVFPEDSNPVREGVAPHKDDKKLKDAPPGARWTKISRKIVNPDALTIGKERFEVRDDFVIVLRVLSKEEIQAYAVATQQLRGKHEHWRGGVFLVRQLT
jgi:zinc finger CCCH domain-containing protein 13